MEQNTNELINGLTMTKANKVAIFSVILLTGASGFSWGADGSMHAHGRKSGLPDTGQTLCYNSANSAAACPTDQPGQDASYRSEASSPSYKDNGDGTITDNRTGLMWVKSGYADTDTTPATTYTADGAWRRYLWEDSILYCERLDYAGHADWRLPKVKELVSIMDFQSRPVINAAYFTNTRSGLYDTSTTNAAILGFKMDVNFDAGEVGSNNKAAEPKCVRCVRGAS